jgi:hypothetical protein
MPHRDIVSDSTRALGEIINLSKGWHGENSTILGSILFTKIELDPARQ